MSDNKHQRRDDKRGSAMLNWDDAPPADTAQRLTSGRAPEQQIKTWRERIGQSVAFPLHAPTDVERAMEAEIAELRGYGRQPAALLNEKEMASLRRFNETCEDGEGYDVPKEMMQRLAGIGAVRRTSGSFYEITEFGMYVLEEPAPAPIPDPFLPMVAHRVDQLLLAHGSIEESRWGPDNPKQYHTGVLGAVNLVRAVEREVQQRFAVLGNCRRCAARGTYAGFVNMQLTSVPCSDCGGTGKTAAGIQMQTNAARDVLAERRRQVEEEGYDRSHDDEHVNDEVAALAAFYAMPPATRNWPAEETGYGSSWGIAILPDERVIEWPCDETVTGRRTELVKAGALVLAEIERIDRSMNTDTNEGGAMHNEVIQAAPVVRDESGCWFHPALPTFDEGQEDEYRDWLDTNGLEITYKMLEWEPDHPLYYAWFEGGENDMSSWTPEPPAGGCWFTLSIHDTEEGPVWVWARPIVSEGGNHD